MIRSRVTFANTDAAAIGDRLLVLRDGRICHDGASGTSDQVHELMHTAAGIARMEDWQHTLALAYAALKKHKSSQT